MRKLLIAALIITASFTLSLAQDNPSPQNATDVPSMGRAPLERNGIGRLDLRVLDENGNPVNGAYAKLKSNWVNGRGEKQYCESWGWTDQRGVFTMLPIHMGTLKLKVEAKGYRKQEIEVSPNSLREPVRVTLARKK